MCAERYYSCVFCQQQLTECQVLNQKVLLMIQGLLLEELWFRARQEMGKLKLGRSTWQLG